MDIFKKTFSSLNEKDVSPFLNQHTSTFRGWGVNGNIELGNNVLLDIEDPTYIVFDINIIDNNESPLFLQTETSLNSVRNFLSRYMGQDPEINASAQIYPEFIKICKLIFPFSGNSNKTKTGSKRHYINSVSGLSVLNKKIINYPEDKITITISEDVSMLSQYFVELYQNMTYSFASQRQLIPNNLLKFDMYLILSDIRDMKFGKIKNGNGFFNNYIDKIIDNKSKYIYVLHDCEFNFLNSKIHGEDITVAGFGATPTNTPATLNVDVIFKSYSRILIPALMSNTSLSYGLILDNKMTDDGFQDIQNPSNKDKDMKYIKKADDRITLKGYYTEIYDRLNDSYISMNDYSNKSNKKTYNISGIDNPNDAKFSNNPEKNSNTYLNKLSKTVKNKFKEFGSSLKNKAYNEANKLKENLQKGVSDAIGVNMTIERINVYYETPEQKIERLSLMANTLINKTANAMQKTVSDTFSNIGKTIKGKEVNYGAALNNFGTIINNDTMNQANGILTGKKVISSLTDLNGDNGNIYGLNINSDTTRGGYIIEGKYDLDDNQYNDKKPSDKQKLSNSNIDDENIYIKDNEKYIVLNGGDESDLHKNSTYNQKFPDDNIPTKGKHNENYPEGDVHVDGKYNEKYPNGDVHVDGKYNEKYPEGDVHKDGKYNKKYPNGDVHVEGEYNKKYPDGDVHTEGQYNIKFPDGDVHQDGKHNEKYPGGDLHQDSKYNKKYPEGDVHTEGQYNIKFPDGDVYPKGKYNKKYPEGNIHQKGNYNKKYPFGDLNEDGQYNIKFPEGDVHEDATYNEKYPNGMISEKGKYNKKYPEGDLNKDGSYHTKEPNKNNIYLDKNNKYKK